MAVIGALRKKEEQFSFSFSRVGRVKANTEDPHPHGKEMAEEV